ncbi:MAG: hypothetical protein HOP14_13695 [Acidobacteria bacterium]|nr:hypothetical protein [Acidobacteriota bacterium]
MRIEGKRTWRERLYEAFVTQGVFWFPPLPRNAAEQALAAERAAEQQRTDPDATRLDLDVPADRG